jgi:hypothetical protein
MKKRENPNQIKKESKQKTNAMRDQKAKRTWMRRRTSRAAGGDDMRRNDLLPTATFKDRDST